MREQNNDYMISLRVFTVVNLKGEVSFVYAYEGVSIINFKDTYDEIIESIQSEMKVQYSDYKGKYTFTIDFQPFHAMFTKGAEVYWCKGFLEAEQEYFWKKFEGFDMTSL